MTKIYEKSEFDTSIRFKPSLISEDASLQALASDLMETMETELGLSFRRQRNLYVMNLTTILCNLLRAAKANKETWLAYPRSEGDSIYKARSIYNVTKLSYSRVTKLMDGLTDLGMIDHQHGFYDRREGGSSRQSRAFPTDDLRERLDDYGVNFGMISRRREIIQLKDADKNLINYTDNRTISRMRSTLEGINGSLSAVKVRLGFAPTDVAEVMESIEEANHWRLPDDRIQIDFTATSLHRIFNNVVASKPRLNHGGRFYGHWVQSVPSEHRPLITMDGQPTCELDYSGLHINMLYARAGLPLPDGDVYEVDVELYRGAMKGILQTLLNARSRKQALASIIDTYRKNPFIEDKELEEAVTAFEAKHAAISQYFGTGIGTELQRQDADMAEMVMLELLDQGVACIPIHDSFIVQAVHADALRQAMVNASKAVLGIDLKVDRKH